MDWTIALPGIALAAIIVCEVLFPFVRKVESGPRLITNLSLGVINHFALRWFAVFLIAVAPTYGSHTGSDSMLSVTFLVSAVICVLALDLINYALHRSFHTFSWAWRLHKLHHADKELDFTTSQRHHPIEALCIVIISAPLFMLTDLDTRILLIYYVLHESASLFAHANIALPRAAERIISAVFVTPDFHRLHHSEQRKQTDSHYGQVFTFWDRMFGTFSPYNKITAHRVIPGLKQHPAEDTLFLKALTLPFLPHHADSADDGLDNTKEHLPSTAALQSKADR